MKLVRGTETVEKVQEGDPSFDSSQMGHRRQIHDLLYAAFRKNSHTRLAAGIDIGMISEDGQCMGGNGSGGNMNHAGEQFSRHAVEIGEHQQ